jgi:benzoyl-CoA reductase/2-hydroxyglutaryl-CoA dehydratase subunit BcrC/BadD/HgdB
MRDPGGGAVAAGGASRGARALERLRDVGVGPRAELARLKERTGLRAVGYFDSYLPEELIMAHGILPYRVTVDGRDDSRSMEHIQGYACPAARNLLDQALRGDLAALDGVLFTRYCDSLRGVFAVWDTERLSPYVDFVRYPTVTTTDTAARYLAAELREVSGRMAAALDAPIEDHRLIESIVACDQKRVLVAELARRRATREMALSGSDYLAVLIAATTMLPDEFTQELSALMAHPPAGEPGDALPVVLSGTTFDNVELAALIEQAGLYIIADDISTGSRWYSVRVAESAAAAAASASALAASPAVAGPESDDTGTAAPSLVADPWLALARAYLTKPPCSVKEPAEPRADHLISQVRGSGARGVVFYLTRYCDSEEVEWPYLRDRLAAEGIPAVMIEGEHRSQGFEQVRTRLEAFREQIEDDFDYDERGL